MISLNFFEVLPEIVGFSAAEKLRDSLASKYLVKKLLTEMDDANESEREPIDGFTIEIEEGPPPQNDESPEGSGSQSQDNNEREVSVMDEIEDESESPEVGAVIFHFDILRQDPSSTTDDQSNGTDDARPELNAEELHQILQLITRLISVLASHGNFMFPNDETLFPIAIISNRLAASLRADRLSRVHPGLTTLTDVDESLLNDPSKSSCCICLEEYSIGQPVRYTKCKHYFHVSCIDTWLMNRTSCPYCRQGI